MIKRILVPVDFSEASLAALSYAVELARPLKAEVVVLHALEPVYYPAAQATYGVGSDIGDVYQAIERSARAQLAKALGGVRARRVRARQVLASGPAYQVVVESAKTLRADLIVMAAHGRTGLSHVLLGSVAERVARLSERPVLIVPARQAAAAPRAGRTAKRTAARSAARRA